MMGHREQTLIGQTIDFQGEFIAEPVFDGVDPNGYTPRP